MPKKNGFIATSIIYSFFVVFSLVTLTILANYPHYRILFNNLNGNILSDLNNLIANDYANLPNLVSNGDFETTDGWTLNNSKISLVTQSDIENGSLAVSYSGLGSAYLNDNFETNSSSSIMQDLNLINKVKLDNKKHKFYVRFRLYRNGNVNSTDGNVCLGTYCFDNVLTTFDSKKTWDQQANWTIKSAIFEITLTDPNASSTTNIETTNVETTNVETTNTVNTTTSSLPTLTLKFYLNNMSSDVKTYIDDVFVSAITGVYDSSTTTDLVMKNYLDQNLDYFSEKQAIAKK